MSEMVPNLLLESIHTTTALHSCLTIYIGLHSNNGENRERLSTFYKATNNISPLYQNISNFLSSAQEHTA